MQQGLELDLARTDTILCSPAILEVERRAWRICSSVTAAALRSATAVLLLCVCMH
jgi:hypothetical protein